MKKILVQLAEKKLVGISVRTNNFNEKDLITGKITPTIQKYFNSGLINKISNQSNPRTTLCVYTNYESDYTGDYTYFIGTEVTSFEKIDNDLETLTIPAQNYTKFTSQPGKMPEVCIKMWHNIWAMDSIELGGKRAYQADFEVYDDRCVDPNNLIIDIYIGLSV